MRPAGSIEPLRSRARMARWTGSRFVVFGGRSADGTVLSDGGIYDPATDTWTPLSPVAAPAPRWHHSATWTGSELVFFGGQGQGSFDFLAGGGILR
jgi:N-acetylneuraminic acid mutarotase